LDEPLWTSGTIGFNAVLFGLALGDVYRFDLFLLLMLVPAAFLNLAITMSFRQWLAKYQLPFLSIPFILSAWVFFLFARQVGSLSLSDHNIFMAGAFGLENIVQEDIRLPEPWWKIYLKSLSGLFFQKSLWTGLLMAIGILSYSRIAFSLSLLGFLAAFAFYRIGGFNETDLTYHYSGFNFILTAIAVGGYFLLPSWRSFLLTLACIPLLVLLHHGLSGLMQPYQLPVYSLSFSMVVIGILLIIQQRVKFKFLQQVIEQTGIPEGNLYLSVSKAERFGRQYPLKLQLPVSGEWMISQGYNGGITHLEQFQYALDFINLDAEMRAYQGVGSKLEDYYCFNKPVLSPADGWVETIVQVVEDNPPGQINRDENWGNTLVIRHAEGVYSKLSHLKKDSIKVYLGQFVRKGDFLATVGNSGRSPEPHLHYQIQGLPHIGSYSFPYPFSAFVSRDHKGRKLKEYSIPDEGTIVSNPEKSETLQQAFNFWPGQKVKTKLEKDGQSEESIWDVFTDAWNILHIRCNTTGADLSIQNDGQFFQCTRFEGDKSSGLFWFFLSVNRILLTQDKALVSEDTFALNTFKPGIFLFLQDFVSPFYLFLKSPYSAKSLSTDHGLNNGSAQLASEARLDAFGNPLYRLTSQINIRQKRIEEIQLCQNKKSFCLSFHWD
jgi:urea transporter/murein DD-endopeptidase MepM/ murein hydrolase activator NlpD